MGKVFAWKNLKERISEFLGRKSNFDLFLCKAHSKILKDTYIDLILTHFINSVLKFTNQVLTGKSYIETSNYHPIIIAAQEIHNKSLKVKNRVTLKPLPS